MPLKELPFGTATVFPRLALPKMLFLIMFYDSAIIRHRRIKVAGLNKKHSSRLHPRPETGAIYKRPKRAFMG
jgi:hypothetical protein